MMYDRHSSKLWWTFSMLSGVFCPCFYRPLSDVLGENVGHDVQNVGHDAQNVGHDAQNVGHDVHKVGHVQMADEFSYILLFPDCLKVVLFRIT